jgi:hypothetical protein
MITIFSIFPNWGGGGIGVFLVNQCHNQFFALTTSILSKKRQMFWQKNIF